MLHTPGVSDDRQANPLIETKLHVPALRRNLVARPRLQARLAGAADAKLVLVSAPAGFGKTTLVTAWLSSISDDGTAVAWLSLDERDNDPAAFWTYALAALAQAVPGLGTTARALLDAADTAPDAVLAALVNELHGVDRDVVLVLDDFHAVDHPDIHEQLTSLLDHLPERAHLVLTTRADPPVPLARLRVRGELVEIRAADLRFTAEEAAAYLNGAMGLELTAEDIATLEARTEGWIAALQLAALSMQGREDVPGFIAGFAGDDRFVVDYLVGEVLQRQPESVRRFMLQTSVLDRLQGSLCDAVTGTTGGKAALEELDRDNLFVIPLDDRREWYRYHHLFADVLRAGSSKKTPTPRPSCIAAPAAWFTEHHEPTQRDPARGGRGRLRPGRRDRRARGAGHAPRPAGRDAPRVGGAHPGARRARAAGARRRVRRGVDVDGRARARQRTLAGRRAVAGADARRTRRRGHDRRRRGAAAGIAGRDRDVPRRAGADRAATSPARSTTRAGCSPSCPTKTSWRTRPPTPCSGSRPGPRATSTPRSRSTPTPSPGCGASVTSPTSSAAPSRWPISASPRGGCATRNASTSRVCSWSPTTGPARCAAPPTCTSVSPRSCASATTVRPRREELRRAEELELFGTAQYPYRSRAVRAGLCLAAGDTAACLELLEEAERVYNTDFSPAVRPIGARRARTYVRQGDLAAARAWVRDRNLATDDELRYVTEFEHITLAIVLVNDAPGERELQQVSAMLDRLLAAAEAGGRGQSVIEILAVQALAFDARGDTPRALDALRRAVALAEPEGYVRVFDYLGPRLRELREALTTGAAPARSSRRSTDSSSRSATASSTCCGCCAAISAGPTSHASSRCRSTRCAPTRRASTPSSA